MMLTSCGSNTPEEKSITELNNQIDALKLTKKNTEQEIDSLNNKNPRMRYVVVIEIKQSHFTWDLESKFKDEMNAIELPVPVDKAFYDSVEEGTVLDDSFRNGSFWFKGSYGKWDISVLNKKTQEVK